MSVELKLAKVLSPLFNGRAYPDIARQDEIAQNNLSPFCVYSIISVTDKNINGCISVNQTLIQIDIYTSSNKINYIKEREDLKNLVFDELIANGFRFIQLRQGFDPDFRLYRLSSDWRY